MSRSPTNWKEVRRFQAWQHQQKGWSPRQIAEAYGFRGQVWTCGRIGAVMHLEFGVFSHPVHVGRLLKTLRWSPQKPIRRARQRDETAITRWREETWPALKRGHKPRGKRSSSSMNPGSLPCPVSSAPMPR